MEWPLPPRASAVSRSSRRQVAVVADTTAERPQPDFRVQPTDFTEMQRALEAWSQATSVLMSLARRYEEASRSLARHVRG